MTYEERERIVAALVEILRPLKGVREYPLESEDSLIRRVVCEALEDLGLEGHGGCLLCQG